MVPPVFVTTTFTIEGHAICEYRGLVRGIVVRSPTLVQGFLGSLQSIVGIRYDGSEVQEGSAAATEVLCYGTAVVVVPQEGSG